MVCPYELNPYQFFGVGIPENMARFTTSYEWSCKNGN